MQILLRWLWNSVLLALAIATVMSAVYWPQAGLVVVVWLLGVALMWRSSPRRDG